MKYPLIVWGLFLLWFVIYNVSEAATCFSMSRNLTFCSDRMEDRMTNPAVSAWQATQQHKY